MENLSVCFFFPNHEVGGVPVLFARMANTLLNIEQVSEVILIDYADGYIAKNVTDNVKLRIIPFVKGQNILIPDNTVLVMQTILPYRIQPEIIFSPETRLFFWTLHPNNIVPNVVPGINLMGAMSSSSYAKLGSLFFPGLVNKLRKFFYECSQKRGICFMDQSTLKSTAQFLRVSSETQEFLPVPVLASNKKIKVENKNLSNKITFCWIGRLCDFKIHILMYTAQKLSDLARTVQIKIEYLVIGDGEYKDKLLALKLNHHNFELKALGNKTTSELDSILLNQVDIVTAMGTSALEGAKFAIPTILLDFSYKPIQGNYRYRWLHDTKNYDLGHSIEADDLDSSNQSLEILLNYAIENYEKLSNCSYNYFNYGHTINSVAKKFLKLVSESDLRYRDLDKEIFKKNFLRKIYNLYKKPTG